MKNLILIGLLLMTGTIATQAEAIKATVRVVSGDATVTLPGSSHATPLTRGESLPAGSVIKTGAGSQVMLSPFPGSSALIKENSEISIDKVTYTTSGSTVKNRAASLGLHLGTMTFAVDPGLEKVTDFKIHAGGAVAAARGASATFNVGATGQAFTYGVVTGGSLVLDLPTGDGGSVSVTLTPGQIFALKSSRENARLQHEVETAVAKGIPRKQAEARAERQWAFYQAKLAREELLQEAEDGVFLLVKAGVAPDVALQEMIDALTAAGINLTDDEKDILKYTLEESQNPNNNVPPNQGIIDESSQVKKPKSNDTPPPPPPPPPRET